MNAELNIETEFKKHENLIHHIIQKHFPHLVNTDFYEDAYQEGCIALLQSIKNFDTNKGYKFSTFVYPAIKRAIYRHTYKFSSDVFISRNVNDTYMKYKQYLKQGYSFDEIIKKLNTTQTRLVNIINAYKNTRLETIIYDDSAITLKDAISNGVDVEKEVETNYDLEIAKKLCKLFFTEENYFVLEEYYNGVTQAKLGRIIGKTQNGVKEKLLKMERYAFPFFKKYMLGEITFGTLCLELTKRNRSYKYALLSYFNLVFNLPNSPKNFLKDIQQELDNWDEKTFIRIKNYFNKDSNNIRPIADNLQNIVTIINKYYKFNNMEDILLKQKEKEEKCNINNVLQCVV